MSPTARTLEECRKRGWPVDVVERWIAIPGHPAGGVRKDWCGFGDILAIAPDGAVIIQATSGSNGAARVTKIREECGDTLRAVCAAGIRVEVWAWKKYVKAVERKYWRPRIERVTP